MTIKAIETHYGGHHFRSRLEARWAVFFDHMGIRWQYELEGFEVRGVYAEPPYRRYLPDFYLPATATWVEVKGDENKLNFNLLADLIDWGGALPGVENSRGGEAGLLLLGDIPRTHGKTPVHPLLQHSKGGCVRLAAFKRGGLVTYDAPETVDYFDSSWGGDQNTYEWAATTRKYHTGTWAVVGDGDPEVVAALRAARSARFEHGEVPQRPASAVIVLSPHAAYEQAKQRLAEAEKEMYDEEERQADEALKEGYCFPCASMHSRCPAGIEDGSLEHFPDLEALVEEGLLPDRALDADGKLIGDLADYEEEMIEAHECAADTCNVCTTCGCPGWTCNWMDHLEDK